MVFYRDNNRVSTVAEPFGLNLTFTWDALGRRTRVEDSLGAVTTSTYDVLDQLTKREFGGQGQTPLRIDLAYTVEGQQESLTRYSDLAGTTKVATTSFTYDAAPRLTNLHHFDGSNNNIANYTYTYDSHSRLTVLTRNGTPVTYTYDDTDQVTADGTATFTYDAEGNRTNEGYSTGTGNQLTSDGTWNYTYDNEGNQTKKVKISDGKTWTYSYDHRNQLSQVQRRTTDGGTLELDVDFKYDPYGNRIEKTVDSDGDGNVDTTQRYALDGWNAAKPSPIGTENWDVVFDLDGSNNLVTRYLRGDVVDQLFARTAANGDAYWYFGDHLGSIRDITDNTGAVKDTLAYDAFGNIISESDANYGGRYKWTGREIDQEIELQYNRARYYDPKIGRWISQDPLGFEAGDGNLYRYVKSRPTAVTDPSGLDAFGDGVANAILADFEMRGKVIDALNAAGYKGNIVGARSETDLGGADWTNPYYELKLTKKQFSSQINVRDLCPEQALVLVQAIEEAENNMLRAHELLNDNGLWAKTQQHLAKSQFFAAKMLLEDRDYYKGLVNEVVNGLAKNGVKSAAASRASLLLLLQTTPGSTMFAGRGGPIYARPAFWTLNSRKEEARIVVHEFGRVFLWTQLPYDGNMAKKGDIGNWDAVMAEVVAAYKVLKGQ